MLMLRPMYSAGVTTRLSVSARMAAFGLADRLMGPFRRKHIGYSSKSLAVRYDCFKTLNPFRRFPSARSVEC
jgi:hypothetical protein